MNIGCQNSMNRTTIRMSSTKVLLAVLMMRLTLSLSALACVASPPDCARAIFLVSVL